MASLIGKLIRNRSIRYRTPVYPLKSISRNNYYFLLPEVPSDTAETNSLLRNDNIPAFNEISPKKLLNGFQKLAVNYDAEFNKVLDELTSADKNKEKKFENLFPPIEKSYAPLDHAYKTTRHLAFTMPYSNYYLSHSQIYAKMMDRRNEKWSNKKFYSVLKELESGKHIMNEQEKRLMDRSIRNCKLNGLHFNEAEYSICIELNNKIREQQSYFKQRLDHANKIFELRLSESMQLDEIPLEIKQRIAIDRQNPNKGPWTLIPKEDVFECFMKYCTNRNLRKTFYEAFYSRASYHKEQYETNNAAVIKAIIKYRKDQAKLYGYENYAQLVMETKAAVSVDNVFDLIEKIRTNLKPVVDDDLKRLQAFSATEGNLTPIDNFDVEFWRTKHTNQHYGIDVATVQQYFPLQKVLNGLFDLSKLLFNVEFKRDDSQKDRLWDPNVQVYNVHDETGKQISTLMIDPFLRNRKINNIWSYSGRESSRIANATPLAYLILNAKNNSGGSSLLTFEQVQRVFSEFGKVIQTLLTQSDYTELSDPNSVEIDAFGLTSKLFDRFLFMPQVMNLVSAHQNTGEPLPLDLLNRLKNANSNFSLFKLMKQTYLSAFDIECHISEKFWVDVSSELWPKFVPIKLPDTDYRPCQFVSVFGEDYACSYYSHIWSDMLATDIFEAFNSVGFENKANIKEVGRRYREHFLKNGSSLHSNEMFRLFRGRNPSMDPFIKSYMPANN